MGFKANIEVKGLEKPRAALAHLADLGRDTTPFMAEAAKVLVASVLGRFQNSRGPGGIPWIPSKRAQGKVKGKPAGKTLVDTGDLQRSIRAELGSNYVEIGSDGLKNPIKALANQFGSHREVTLRAHSRTVGSLFGARLRRRRTLDVSEHQRITNLPARPFIGVDDADVAQIKGVWLAILRQSLT